MSQTIGTVKVRVNTSPSVRVQSINYLGSPGDFAIASASDVQILNSANNNSVLTYDATTQKFLVQNVPTLNGGTF